VSALDSGAVDTAVVEAFHRLYYGARQQTWKNTFWQGHAARKCPLDLWVYQELLVETRPDVIIETGTAEGGSALFLANVCDMLANGIVISVDVQQLQGRPVHQRIHYLEGSSVDDATVAQVSARIAPGASVMAVLDSDHTAEHVLAELRIYAVLVTPGCYLVVEDTNVNGHPVREAFGPGPMEAVDAFLAESSAFEVDQSREKFFMTFNPRGYLRRVR
jgi:cephalosporin hydroxylase